MKYTLKVCRYPAYIFKQSKAAAKLRYAVPILTFPLGAGGEAFACYEALAALGSGTAYRAAVAQIVLNLAGFAAAYPGLVKRGLAAISPPKKKRVAGVVFPITDKSTGERSTTVTGKEIWSALALALGDSTLRDDISREKDWRHGYPKHVRAIAAATLRAPPALAVAATQAALDALHSRLEFVRDGRATSLATVDQQFPLFAVIT